MEPARLRRRVVLGIIAILGSSTLISIVLVLAEPSGDFWAKVAGSSGVAVLFTLFWLLSAMSFERRVFPAVGVVGMLASALAFLLAILHIWGAIDPSKIGTVKPTFMLVIVAIASAWSSAIIVARGRDRRVDVALVATSAVIFLIGLIAILLLVSETEPDETVGKLLSVLATLAVFGTFLVPLLSKLASLEAAAEQAAPSEPPGP